MDGQEITQHRGQQALAPQHSKPSSAYSTPASIVPQLASCLALVRPVSMTDEAAAEWLAVAANELAGYEAKRLENGLNAARRTCTHHGQIVPTIFQNMRYEWDLRPLERRLPKPLDPPAEIQGLISSATKALTDG